MKTKRGNIGRLMILQNILTGQKHENLKPSLKTISIRLPEIMVEELKLLANKRDVPYQSLMKIFIAERVEQELNK